MLGRVWNSVSQKSTLRALSPLSTITCLSPTQFPAVVQKRTYATYYTQEEIDEIDGRLPSIYSVKDRKKVNVIPELNNMGIMPVLKDSQWLVPRKAAHRCLEVIEKNKMMILAVSSFSVERGRQKKVTMSDRVLDMDPMIHTHEGKTEELVDKCVSAASNFLYDLENDKVEDLHYVSFITTENWGGEEEGGTVVDEDGNNGGYEFAEDTR